MAYRDYICCRDCKSKFIYDGDNNIRRSLEFAYGDKNAPNWTVELVCPNCLERLERKPLTDEEVDTLLVASAGMTVKANDVDLRFARAIEKAHGIE